MLRPATSPFRWPQTLRALALFCAFVPAAQAALFEDDEARRAILELRQRMDALQQSSQRTGEDLRRTGDDGSQVRRSLLDLQTQIDAQRAEIAKLRGQNEQLTHKIYFEMTQNKNPFILTSMFPRF